MREGLKQTVEAIGSHPKVAVGLTALFTSNVWLNYGEPIIKGLTSIVGLVVLVLLVVKHSLDIKKEHFSKSSDNKLQ